MSQVITWTNEHKEVGKLIINPNGTIEVCVPDDWYSGVIDAAQVKRLFDALCPLYDIIQAGGGA